MFIFFMRTYTPWKQELCLFCLPFLSESPKRISDKERRLNIHFLEIKRQISVTFTELQWWASITVTVYILTVFSQ